MRNAQSKRPSTPNPSAWTAYPSRSSRATSSNVATTDVDVSTRARRKATSASNVQRTVAFASSTCMSSSTWCQDTNVDASGCNPRSSPTLRISSSRFFDDASGRRNSTHSSPCAPTRGRSASWWSRRSTNSALKQPCMASSSTKLVRRRACIAARSLPTPTCTYVQLDVHVRAVLAKNCAASHAMRSASASTWASKAQLRWATIHACAFFAS
mmetsp:Transcript_10/g.67  ORF Transcript_10/g.67 Transcript_10/m.67 type:complete len:212 (-) Transcript_10:474-1109(-)